MGKTVKKFMEGNDAMVAGAIAAGARFYAGYPISPSSEVAKGAAKELPRHGGVYIQMEDEIGGIARFIKNDLGAETPWHVSAFYPTHRLTDAPRTPHSTLHRARQIGIDEGLRYVYEGNIPGSDGENTYCYNCKKLIIRRYGYSIIEYNIEDGFCKYCNATIDGIGL